jgi:protein-tyrosine phosphatase
VIDLHAHILPGFDDGVPTLQDARALARFAAAEGVTAIAATPHVRDDWPTRPERMERGVAALRADFAEQGIPVAVVHGGELDLARLWTLDEDDVARFTYAQKGRCLLVEMPYRGWPQVLEPTVASLRGRGITPLLAHPERNDEVRRAPERLASLVADGALVQVTAGSVAGTLGGAARATALRLLELDLVHILATDAHGAHVAGRGGLAAGAAALGDDALARRLTVEVPRAILAGAPVLL